MTTLLQLNYPPTWNHCPVFLPYEPHTISPIVPGYLGLLLPFLVFSIYLFMYLYSMWTKNFDSDVNFPSQSTKPSHLMQNRRAHSAESPYVYSGP